MIAEVWAFEMFQSGEHQDDVWSYVAALHTDRAHPHVHIVVNNRGTLNDSWFFMAKDHVFNLDMMKERMVAIAAPSGTASTRSSPSTRAVAPAEGRVSVRPARRKVQKPLLVLTVSV